MYSLHRLVTFLLANRLSFIINTHKQHVLLLMGDNAKDCLKLLKLKEH